jgi:ATP phosphoribosyltransferase
VNGLRRIGSLLDSQAVLVRGRDRRAEKDELVDRLALMLGAVVAARRRRYVMMNASASSLEAIRALLPSMGAPSVLELADPGQIAIHAAIETDQVWDLLAPLKAAGATSILVVPVERLVP